MTLFKKAALTVTAVLFAAVVFACAEYDNNGSGTAFPDKNPEDTSASEITTPAAEPITAKINHTSVFLKDDGTFKFYRIKPENFIDTVLSFSAETLYKAMKEEQAHLNRILAANNKVNTYVYVCTRMQDTAYFNELVPDELSTYDMLQEFMSGIVGADGVDQFDIGTVEKRLEKIFKTDHHWNVFGSYEGYTDVIAMMNDVYPDIGEPIPMKGTIDFPAIAFRGSAARRGEYAAFTDVFQVIDIDLPVQHKTERVVSNLEKYKNGSYDNKPYATHYENFYNRPSVITYPENKTGRRLLIIGDSYSYWASWLIGAHFDKTHVYYCLNGNTMDYNKFIEDNAITDVLIMQFSSRLFQGSSIKGFLDQIKTR